MISGRLHSFHGNPPPPASHQLKTQLATAVLDGALSRRKNRRHRWTGRPHRSAGILVRTVACPVPPGARPRLRGARPGTAQPPRLPAPLVVTRRVSVRGAIMVGGQRIQVGLAHARKTVNKASNYG